MRKEVIVDRLIRQVAFFLLLLLLWARGHYVCVYRCVYGQSNYDKLINPSDTRATWETWATWFRWFYACIIPNITIYLRGFPVWATYKGRDRVQVLTSVLLSPFLSPFTTQVFKHSRLCVSVAWEAENDMGECMKGHISIYQRVYRQWHKKRDE